MKKFFPLSLAASLTVLASACGADNVQEQAGEAETEETENEAEDSADDEEAEEDASADGEVSGTLSFYTSQPDEDADALIEGFNEIHPDVEVEVFRSGTEEVISRLLAEEEAGSAQADVLLLADAVTFEGLKEDDLLHEYESPELDAIPEQFVDEDGMYTGTKIMSTVLAYNTELVEDEPVSWADLTSDEAENEVIMPSPLYSGAAAYNAGVFSRTDGFGWEFYEDLHENDTTTVQGNGDVLQNVAGGEKAYGMVVDFVVANAKEEGSPIDLVYPEEGVPVITEPVGIMDDAENVEAAEAFVDFILSEEGQELSTEVGYVPIRAEMDPPEDLQGAEEVDELSADLNEMMQTRDEDTEEFNMIFGE
ncbi:ABC transporter substrate-binding protein [Salicibibacter kimchii]|uniref:Extracellular solute-binding protein n=1 Tax=Salicibibacter kimchii TaxID=2099786 RepID=A0A345BY59_9BACI|nr:ABC transporter substrate-binding protein [Salicibibacter kimchii]AXF55890.1 extracellular solute-binding protein [Salicibibacter kimchii]